MREMQRMLQGGHGVPSEKIISSIPRTMHDVRVALPLVDMAQLYDNSQRDQPFNPVAFIHHGNLQQQVAPLPEWAETMLVQYLN